MCNGGVFSGTMRLERQADNSPTSSAEVKNEWSFASTPPRRLRCVCREGQLYLSYRYVTRPRFAVGETALS